jgi:hypothetical protein
MAQVSPLRRRMIEDMTVRNMSPATQRSYVSAVSKFSRYFGKSPERLNLEDVRAFQVHLVSTGVSWPGAASRRIFRPCAWDRPAWGAHQMAPINPVELDAALEKDQKNHDGFNHSSA